MQHGSAFPSEPWCLDFVSLASWDSTRRCWPVEYAVVVVVGRYSSVVSCLPPFTMPVSSSLIVMCFPTPVLHLRVVVFT